MNTQRTIVIAFALMPFALSRAQSDLSVYNEQTGRNEEIELPDGMGAATSDSLLREWNVRKYITLDESCLASSENPEFSKEEYTQRLSHLPNVIEMPYNDAVRQCIDQYSVRLRRTVSLMLGAGNFYIPIFEDALEMYQLPLELKYLPVIESALNPKAVSRVGAVGLWQFVITTAKQYGLEVTSLVDERCDPVKSSYAAARYLKDLYAIFGDWNLVLAAYNCGPNNVSKAIKRAGGSTDYWKIYTYLPKETRGYVPAFIAANYIMNYYCEHNICPASAELATGTDTILVNRDVRFEQIADLCGISLEEIRALNPQYRTTLVPGEARPSSIRLTTDALNTFLTLGDSVFNYKAEELLAKRQVEVPVQSTQTTSSSKGKGKTSSRGASYITVKSGDNLGAIARRNGTTVAQLKRLNGLRGDGIRAGQKLRVK
ncbi:MAG: transglycosylase SLT domain-containing protein [Prevotellaceae bacterium]|nr:transglycosylase SLT domain-containing protein [Prevotellaceae bacterium]MCD8303317.1 transglycosylase SLT domain-containing protein [Prevotellaceae bacterium]